MRESSQYPDSSVAQLGVRTGVRVLRDTGGELLLGGALPFQGATVTADTGRMMIRMVLEP